MLGLLKKLFGGKPAEATAEAPYKVETPAIKDYADIALAQQPTPVAEKATEAVVKSVAPEKKKPAPKKAPAPKKEGTAKKGGRKPKSKPAV